MPDVGFIFEQQLSELKEANVRFLAGKPWFDRLYIRNFSSFFHCLADLLEIIDDAYEALNRHGDARILQCDQVKRLHDFLHSMAVDNIRYLSPSIPGAADDYEDAPLVLIYDGVATCVQFLRQFFPTDDYYSTRPADIPYCVRHELTAAADVEIRAFTLQQLIGALTQLEQSAHTLTYSEELVAYVDALDARVCDFLLFAMPDVAHNIESYRVQYAPDLYTCNTGTEYQLIVLILAVRQLIESAAPLWRDEEEEMPCSPDDELLVATVRAKFIAEIQSVHSDIVEENFYKRYTQESISNSEGYLFMKANPTSTRIEPGPIIRQFRNVPQWRRITETAARPVSDFLFEPELDFLGFKIAFMLAADLIFSQTLRASWFEFYADGNRVRAMNATEYQVFIDETYRVPIIVVLLNDACVMFRGSLTVFGRRHTDYYRAFVHWMAVVQHELGGCYKPHRTILPIVDALFREPVLPPRHRPAHSEVAGISRRDFVTKDGEESPCIDPDRIIAELNAERRPYRPPPPVGFNNTATPISVFMRFKRAKADYEHAVALISTKPQEIDASAIGDTDEAGLPRASRSAWL